MENTKNPAHNKEIDSLDMAVHQLRTPLTRNKWSLNLLIHDSLSSFSADEKELLRKIYDDNERAIRMINDTLRADHEEVTASETGLVKVNITELVEKTMNEIRPDALGKNIAFELTKTDNEPSLVLADPNKINYVFENILLNAIRYTPQGGSISIHIKRTDTDVVVSIQDNGIGIPEEEKNHIFEKFYRAGNARRVESDGTGLGLFITKHIVEGYGGKIWFESEENKGTIFKVALPVISVV